ncbi:hypothetical protein AA0121_g6104 [Alternaria tenuissima]|nr:hypothetical protein AA0121_g6104 [Alternaria tenuissima]
MTSLVRARKRKEAHNQIHLSRDKGKIRVIERSAEGHSSPSTKNLQGRNSTPASRTFTTLRRGSIKIFSIFRNSKSMSCSAPSPGEATFGSTGSTANKSKDVPRVDTVKSYSNSPLQCPIVPDVPMTLPTLSLDPDSSSLLQLTNAAVFDGESEPIPRARTPPSAPISTSWSSPNLSWQLTSKLSNALLKNDTVVHRPKLSSRPTVKADQFNQPSDDQQTATSPKSPMSEVPSLPSSVLSPASSNAPLSQSTAPTSLVSSGAPLSTETLYRTQNGRHITDNSPALFCEPTPEHMPPRFLVFPRQDAPRLCEPSIATIEHAAAAKTFFESHFNQLLGTKVAPRSMRRRQMERKLFAMAIPNEQRHCKRRE